MVACSTQKNTWLSRNYNSVTAKYNTLYNGQQSFKRGEQKLMQSNKDNYTSTLNIFPYSGPDKSGVVKAEMDRAIEKALKVIQKKSITVQPKRKPNSNNPTYETFYNQREFNRQIDDAYLLIGKAHLYNHEYNDALAILDYTLREFPSQPARFEALIWMARTRIEMGDFENAKLLLDNYDAMGKAPEKYYADYMATYADYLIRSEQYNNALPFMMTATSEAKGKWNKSRRHFILAQLYEYAGQYQKAFESYQAVAKSNPKYELELNATIKSLVLEGQLQNDYTHARKTLTKMADQLKNEEFRDIIYFTLANSYLQEKDTLQTLTNLQLSAGYNIDNQTLLSETYLKMAELYFELPHYPASYAYYDSTLTLLPETDKRIKQINFRYSGLKDLTIHFNNIEREDSLQRLAKLSKPEIDSFIDALIEKERQAQLNKTLNASRNNDLDFDYAFGSSLANRNNGSGVNQGQWYFYNPTTVSLGKMEFERKWGRRKAEDNWRRSDKSSQSNQNNMQEASMPGKPGEDIAGLEDKQANEPTNEKNSTNLPTKEELLANIPTTPEQIAKSHEILAKSYFYAGMIFMDHFNKPQKAIEMFNKLINAYPEHTLTEQAIFWSSLAFKELGNITGQEKMKQKLLSDFPNGQYAPFVRDPEYANKLIASDKKLQKDYENAFEAYKNNQFNQTIKIASKIKAETKQKELLRKTYLLSAVSYGKLGNNTGFISELQVLVNNYANSPEGRMASQWLAMNQEGLRPAIGKVISKPKIEETKTGSDSTETITGKPTESGFIFEADKEHHIFVLVNSLTDINQLIFNLADYNFNRFLLANYDLATQNLSNGKKIVTIGPFANSREAMDYYYGLRSNTRLLQVENIEKPMLMAGTDENLKALIKLGDLSTYQQFFSNNYLNGGGGIVIDMTFENLEKDKEESEPQAIFSSEDGIHWGLIVVPSGNNINRISGFLTSHALNTFRQKINVRSVKLNKGNTALIVETFNTKADAEDFISSLKDVSFWNNQLRATNWFQTFVSPQNFKLIESEGEIEKYANFQKELE